MFDVQRNVVLCAESGAEIRPRIGVRTDAVMDVQGGKQPVEAGSKRVQQMQQHDGIHAAAQADKDMTATGKKRRETHRNSVS